MRFARPPGGFLVDVPDSVKEYIEGYESDYPHLDRFWEDIVETLRFVGHRVGRLEPKLGPDGRVYRAESDPRLNLPRLMVGYGVMGETVSVRWVVLDTR